MFVLLTIDIGNERWTKSSFMAEERGDYHRDAYMNDRSHVSGTPLFGGG